MATEALRDDPVIRFDPSRAATPTRSKQTVARNKRNAVKRRAVKRARRLGHA